MKQFEGFTIQIEGNKVIINRDPETSEEKQLLYDALVKAYGHAIDSMGRAAIMEVLEQYEK